MCGRYALYSRLQIVADLFRVLGDIPAAAPRFNIAPSQDILIIREQRGSRQLAPVRWGFVPAWSTEPAHLGAGGPPPPINARSETVESKPAFREAFRARRCLVPADGFYEWKLGDAPARAQAPAKQPFFITTAQQPFAMAGLWERWQAVPSAEHAAQPFESGVILTTKSNTLLADFHDRMPVILPSAHWDRWLDPATPPAEVRAMLQPFPAERMSLRPVSRRVNSPRNDDADCIAPPSEDQMRLKDPPTLFG